MSYILLPDDFVHLLIVGLSLAVLIISIFAYKRRRQTRYLLLPFAFLFMFISQFISLLESLFYSDVLLVVPYVGVHLAHLFDLFTLVAFGLALFKRWD